MTRLRNLPLVDASVPVSATFREAAHALADAGTAAVAVLDGERRVVGLFTDDDVLRGVFPRYVEELRHTAFAHGAAGEIVRAGIERAAGEPVERHMREPITIEVDSDAIHVAERFLHCPWGAIAVVDGGRYVGILRQVDFVAALLPER